MGIIAGTLGAILTLPIITATNAQNTVTFVTDSGLRLSMIYHRPNLTSAEQTLLADLIRDKFVGLSLDDPAFDPLYRLYIKVRDAKPFNTSKS